LHLLLLHSCRALHNRHETRSCFSETLVQELGEAVGEPDELRGLSGAGLGFQCLEWLEAGTDGEEEEASIGLLGSDDFEQVQGTETMLEGETLGFHPGFLSTLMVGLTQGQHVGESSLVLVVPPA